MRTASFTAGGKKFVLSVSEGTVVEVRDKSETKVTGSGGGGRISTYNNRVSGYIRPIDIQSTTISRTTLWLQGKNGQEEEVKLPVEVSARPSHSVAVVYVSDEDFRKSYYAAFINKSTQSVQSIIDPAEIAEKYLLIEQCAGWFFYILMGAIPGGILTALMHSPLSILFLPVSIVCGFFLYANTKSKVEKNNTIIFNAIKTALIDYSASLMKGTLPGKQRTARSNPQDAVILRESRDMIALPEPQDTAAPQARFCTGCGAPMEPDDAFCTACGRKRN